MTITGATTQNVEGFIAHLASVGRLTAEGADRALLALGSTHHPIDVVLTELGLCRDDELAAEAGSFIGAPVFTEVPPADEEMVDAIGLAFLEEHALLPVSHDEDTIVVCMSDPFRRDGIDAIEFMFDRPAIRRIATRGAILARLREATDVSPAIQASDQVQAVQEDDVERLKDIAREAPVVRLVSRIVAEAADRGATDIHIEPHEENVRIRLRLDGMLVPVETVPRGMHAGVVTRIKIMAQLNIAERRLPQDGRLRVSQRGQNIDIRVSIVPSSHGETMVLRLLDRSRVKLDLAALGFDGSAADMLSTWARAMNGIVLVTGPTGSGKTTSLYAMLSHRVGEDLKIFTVEDPIEYRLAGVTQMQVEPAIGLDFSAALRAVLRQDPDVILIGEIRDRETAEIAIRAALTGHLVLATLHTTSAAGAFSRLRDIGIDSYLLAATIRGVAGQRLLRKRCLTCDGAGVIAGGTRCAVCHGSGHAGRVVTYELLRVSERIAALVSGHAGEADIRQTALDEGMCPLPAHALSLAEARITSHDEVTRIFELGGG